MIQKRASEIASNDQKGVETVEKELKGYIIENIDEICTPSEAYVIF